MPEYANVLSRGLAVIIDHFILLIITFLIALPFGIHSMMFSMMARFTNPFASISNIALWLGFIFSILIVWLFYFSYLESRDGQTIGKKLVNIKVVKENGRKISFEDALLRTILRVVDGLVFYLLGFFVILLTDKKQRLGDIAAKTIVVKA